MAARLNVRLFGVLHVDRPSKVTEELDAETGGVDALFVELPDREVTPWTLARCLLRTPAFFLGTVASGLAVATVTLLVTGGRISAEALAVERVADDRDLPVHRVDDHPVQMAARAGPRWVVPNWALLLALAGVWPAATASTAVVLLAGLVVVGSLVHVGGGLARVAAVLAGWSALVGGLLAGAVFWPVLVAVALASNATVLRSVAPRNEYMLDRVEEITAREGYEDVCLVTGKAHLRGLVVAADETGASVPRVHASKLWRRSDAVFDDPAANVSDVPGIARPALHRRLSEDSTASDSTASDSSTPGPTPARGTERAAVPRRVIAAVLDLVGMAAVSPFVAVAAGVVTALTVGFEATGGGVVAGFLVAPFAYTTATEAAFGRTPGKALLGLVVVSLDGSPCTWRAAAVRNLLRPVDLLGGVLALAVTFRHRRLGDLAAGTVVVRTARGNR